jgi:hypothetical protein
MPQSSTSPQVSFEHAGQHLESVYGHRDRESEDFVVAILRDLHQGTLPDRFIKRPDLYFETAPV